MHLATTVRMSLVLVSVYDSVPGVGFEQFGHVLNIGESEHCFTNIWVVHCGGFSGGLDSSRIWARSVSLFRDSTNEIGACLRVRCSMGTVQGWV